MKPLYRCRWNKKIGGVCGGLGQYFKIDPSILRLIMLLATIYTAIIPGLIIYAIAWIFIPESPAKAYIEPDCKRIYRSGSNFMIGGVCSGIASYLRIDPLIVRIISAIAMVLTGFLPFIFFYICAVVLLPVDNIRRRRI